MVKIIPSGPAYFEGRANNNERSRTFFDHSHPYELTWEAVNTMVASDPRIKNYVDEARRCRAEGDTDGYNRYKQMGGAITPAAVCRGGHKQADIVSLTGCTLVDLDHIEASQMDEARRKVWADPHTMMAWTTASGEGIRVIARYHGDEEMELKHYLCAWNLANAYYSTLTGLEADPATKDPNRLSFISHDEEVLYNPESTPFELEKAKPLEGTKALDLATEWVDRTMSYQPGNRHNYVVEIAKVLNKLGIDEAEAERLVESRYGDLDDRLTTLRSIYRNNTAKHGMLAEPRPMPKAKAMDKEGKTTPSQYREMILDQCDIRHNELSRQSELRPKGSKEWRPLTDKDLNTIAARIGDLKGCMVSPKTIVNVVNSNLFPTVRPLKEYLDTLPQWDGTDYVGELLKGISLHNEAERELVERYVRVWLRGMVGGWSGKSANQLVFVLLGAQGRGKSTFFRHLLPPELEPYFMTQVNTSRMDKDEQFALTENALICLDEFDTMYQRENNRLKAMITMDAVKARAAYGMVPERRSRLATYCGTGNNIQFLTDITGNRRFLPVWVENVDHEAASRIGHERIYSQLKAELEEGLPYFVTQQQSDAMAEYLDQFMASDATFELVTDMVLPKDKATRPTYQPASKVVVFIHSMTNIHLEVREVGRILSKLGYDFKTKSRTRYYNIELNTAYYGKTI